MSMPAGWYDDGSGRQRWWDGARWTHHVAPGAGAPAVGAAGPVQLAPPPSAARVRRNASAVGIFGLGLAGFGTVIGSLESSYIVGIVALIVGFVMSLVGLFMRNTSKWPAVAGLLLSILGAAFATVVVLGVGFLGDADATAPSTPAESTESSPATSDAPAAPAPSQPSATDGRPSADALGEALLADLQSSGLHDYDDDPEFLACWGEYVYASELSDEGLQEYVDTLTLSGHEAALLTTVSTDATVKCGAR